MEFGSGRCDSPSAVWFRTNCPSWALISLSVKYTQKTISRGGWEDELASVFTGWTWCLLLLSMDAPCFPDDRCALALNSRASQTGGIDFPSGAGLISQGWRMAGQKDPMSSVQDCCKSIPVLSRMWLLFFIRFTCFLTQSLHPYKIIMLKAVIYTERNMGGTRPFLHLYVWSSPCCISCVARNAIGCTGLAWEPGMLSLLGELFSGKSQEAPGKHACSGWRGSWLWNHLWSLVHTAHKPVLDVSGSWSDRMETYIEGAALLVSAIPKCRGTR